MAFIHVVDMADDISSAFEEDMRTIAVERVSGKNDSERAMKLVAHMLLRVWTRIALDAGQKLSMTPFQYSLGTYHGQMNWVVNDAFNFEALPQIELGAKYGMRHALVSETYQQKGEDRVRLMFALEEEGVKGQPLMVNYLLYDSAVRDFRFEKAAEALKPALPKWLETITSKSDGPLWEFCKDNLECVGV